MAAVEQAMMDSCKSLSLPREATLHGVHTFLSSSPCNFKLPEIINAWGMTPKGQIPMHSTFRKLLKCMGYGH